MNHEQWLWSYNMGQDVVSGKVDGSSFFDGILLEKTKEDEEDYEAGACEYDCKGCGHVHLRLVHRYAPSSARRRVIWNRVICRSMKITMSSSGRCSLGWVCPSASIEDVVKSFELIVRPGLRYNKQAAIKGCIVFVQSP